MRILPRYWFFSHQLESLESRRALSVSPGGAGEPVADEVPVLLNGAGSELVFESTLEGFDAADWADGGEVEGSAADDDLYDFGGAESDGLGGIGAAPDDIDLTPLFDPSAVSIDEDISGFNEWDAAWLGDADAVVDQGSSGVTDDDLYNFGEYLAGDDDLVVADPEVEAHVVSESVAILEDRRAPVVLAAFPAELHAEAVLLAVDMQITSPDMIAPAQDVSFVSLAVPDMEPAWIALAPPEGMDAPAAQQEPIVVLDGALDLGSISVDVLVL